MQSTATKNPDKVIITSVPQCEIHGWTPGMAYATLEHEITTPDANGYQIYVHSVLRNRPIALSSIEYELLPDDKQLKVMEQQFKTPADCFKQLEDCGFICIGGKLEDNVAYQQLKKMLCKQLK